MSCKGKTFTDADLPRRARSRPEAMKQAWLKSQTERYKVVAQDPDAPTGKRDIIAEELTARILAKMPEKVRRIVPLMLRLSVGDRLAIVRSFDEQGRLNNPFTIVT